MHYGTVVIRNSETLEEPVATLSEDSMFSCNLKSCFSKTIAIVSRKLMLVTSGTFKF